MTPAVRFSYVFVIAVFILAAASHLAVPLVAMLFAYFALRKLQFTHSRWLSLALFLVLVAVVLYGVGWLIAKAVVELPKIADESIPPLIDWANKHGFELPFTDMESLKTVLFDVGKDKLLLAGNLTRAASRQLVFVLIAIVIATSLFLRTMSRVAPNEGQPSLLSALTSEIAIRFRLFYESFERVMGAQITISTINTVLTAIFIAAIGLKYFPLIIGLTFVCGLLPIVGNLISN